jgi:hypothetical protein
VLSKRIVNASPLILLSKIGQLDLLRMGGVDVSTPDAVIAEIGARSEADLTALAIRQTGWLSIVASPAVPDAVGG